jgi:hypothetical protein
VNCAEYHEEKCEHEENQADGSGRKRQRVEYYSDLSENLQRHDQLQEPQQPEGTDGESLLFKD